MIEGESSQAIIKSGLNDALSTMESMPVNSGQESIYQDYVVDAFEANAEAPVDEGWTEVDIGEYMDFMGEIVAEGNNIMTEAYEYAYEVQAIIDAISPLPEI